jgi:hypothetical protein
MDPQLAALYGTDEETDTEKLAAAEMAEGLAEEEQFDVATATDEQVEALAQEFLASEGTEETAEVAEAEEPKEEEQVKMSADEEAQEKLAEADYLGRVMAHAYVAELRGIESGEKTAAPYGEKEKEEHKRIARGASNVTGAGYGAAGAFAGHRGAKHLVARAAEKAVAAGGKAKGPKTQAALRAAGAVGGALAGGAAGKGVGYAATRAGNRVARMLTTEGKKEKKSSAETEEMSALDVLAERRALEILEANGIQLEAPEAVETEKVSASEEEMNLLAQAVEARAEELLAANGYEFEQE